MASAASLIATASAGAATIQVSGTADEFGSGSACGLREAIEAANQNAAFGGCSAGSGPDTIRLPAGTYGLTRVDQDDTNEEGDLDVIAGSVVTIAGAGARTTAVEVAGDHGVAGDRPLHVAGSATLAASGITFRKGNPNGGGGGVLIGMNASVTLTGVVVTANSGGSGGAGILNGQDSTLVLRNSVVSNNTGGASSGAIHGLGDETLVNVTMSGNRAEHGSGAFREAGDGTATLTNVTVTGNTADFDGDGSGDGGGVEEVGAGNLTLRNSVVAGNFDGSSPGAPDCNGPISSAGGNLIGSSASCEIVTLATDRSNANARLGALQDNGGTTPTHALLAASPAIGLAVSGCPAEDQRGAPRANCDSGSYERVRCRGVVVNRVGTAGPDNLRGTGRADGILGLAGADLLRGLGGRDALCGGGGRDRLLGGKGRDKLVGGKGRDRCRGGAGPDVRAGCERGRG